MESTKVHSSAQESMIAKFLGWSVVSGSGASNCHPGDLISDEWLGECKTHISPGKRIQFNFKVWSKICEEASSKFRYPVLFVDDGSQKLANTWVMFPYHLASCPNIRIVTTEITGKSNLSFDHSDMLTTYVEHQECSDDLTVLSVVVNGKRVGICPISSFKRMFGE